MKRNERQRILSANKGRTGKQLNNARRISQRTWNSREQGQARAALKQAEGGSWWTRTAREEHGQVALRELPRMQVQDRSPADRREVDAPRKRGGGL